MSTEQPNTEIAVRQQPKPLAVLRGQLEERKQQFVLPAHISHERFFGAVTTAVSMDAKLLSADRTSLLQSCLKAAQDGLLLDKREAALVVYGVKDSKTGSYVDMVQYMPMVRGVLKLLRNSGELSTITAQCVYENDEFDFELGLNAKLSHKYKLDAVRGKLIGAYAVAKLKDGSEVFEVMGLDKINKRRAVSRSYSNGGKGPWRDWYDEMACKTVLRALCKLLPSSTDIDRVSDRMDDDVDLSVSRRNMPSLTDTPEPAPLEISGDLVEQD